MASIVTWFEQWREQPYDAVATIDLCTRFVRELSKPHHNIDLRIAEELVDRAAPIHERDVEVVLSLAGLSVTTGNLDRAEQLLGQLPERERADLRVVKLLGKVKLHMGVRAQKFGQRSLSPSPSSAPPSDRQANAADLLARLNRQMVERHSSIPAGPASRPAPASVRSPGPASVRSPAAPSGPPPSRPVWPPNGRSSGS